MKHDEVIRTELETDPGCGHDPYARPNLQTSPGPRPAPHEAHTARKRGVLLRALTFGATGGLAGLLIMRSLNQEGPGANRVSRHFSAAATTLAFSILADSTMEHYRGGFRNRVMYVAPTVSALTLLAGIEGLRGKKSAARAPVFACAIVTGLVGAGFHTFNVVKREGGLSWLNAFYGAPIGAPLGLTFAGLAGLASNAVARNSGRLDGRLGRLTAVGAAVGLMGTAAEAGLLHFRGAFHDPFMYLPVSIPPLAASALMLSAMHPARASAARVLLQSTAVLGFAGMGFHAYGVQRNMGGWRNWSQMLQGPPVPAPPSFTGMALAGLAALSLLKGDEHER
ncbi:hypothetical protein [Deinococcus peraridilitoris]|uniref:Uncharacterized protein n=1 Tax=Deinococcus peraridilitoris (strain DSM 19664 / LMG 22246 / CIP 109416 / KR-200) TaxID=937777 RepID=L0A8A4_DEIPD|nr:hypothetical protein [Deinococcus peraridilitoris]AFZ69305.1 hypothetical protein Deipe_3890 [Deinococcus peraridilitoris DSM 19664]